MASTVAAASRKHVELSLELKRKLIQEHEHGVPFTLLGKKYHIATSTAANIWRKKDFFLRSRMSGSRKRCNDRSKYKIVNQVTALFVKSMLERNHKIDGEVIKRFARTAAAQCNFKDFHGSNGWLDSFKKRENVCWVRRRGERSAAAAAALHLATNGAGQSLVPADQQSACRRSNSPNLSAAAAAAALAASAVQQQQHPHRHSPPLASQQANCAWPSSTGDATGDPDSGAAVGACARCSVAAAAAAVAALNSSDSLHERDHEIEDWFHGIPFLCQFFEDYQSMHQSQSDSSGSNSVSAAGTSSQQQQQQQQTQQQQQQQHQQNCMVPMTSQGGSRAATFVVGATGSVCSSSSSSSSTCSTYLHSQQSLTALSLAGGSSASSLGQSSGGAVGLTLSSSSSSASTASSNNMGAANNYLPGRSLSDAHELMETSLADMQALSNSSGLPRAVSTGMLSSQQQQQQQQQQIKCEQYSTTMSYESTDNNNIAFQQQPQQHQTASCSANFSLASNSSSSSCSNNNNSTNSNNQQAANDSSGCSNDQQQQQQLMEISFTQGNSDRQQHQRQARDTQDNAASMDIVITTNGAGGSAGGASCCQLESCQNKLTASQSGDKVQALMATSDYNSDDQDFYLSTARYIPHDARSDDLLYHDEVSDHNDCCSDHYDQTGVGVSELQQLRDHYHQSECQLGAGGPQAGGDGSQAASGDTSGPICYMDEYEYENISTIRHYPVPMPPPPPPPTQQQQVVNLTQDDSTGYSEDPQQHGQQQQQHQELQQQVGACQQQQQQLAQLAVRQQQGFGSQIGQLTAADYQQQQQHQQQQQQQQGCPDRELKVLQQEHEQMIEHADHEEHNMLHNALMRSPEKLKLIDSIITLLNYASNYNQKMLVPLLEIKRCIERDLEVVLSDTTAASGQQQQQQSNCCSMAHNGNATQSGTRQNSATGASGALLSQSAAGNSHKSRDILLGSGVGER